MRRTPRGVVLIGALAICGMALPLYEGPLPASLPEASVWGPLVLAAMLVPLLFRRSGASLEGDEIVLRRGWGREAFALRSVARIEMAPWASRKDLHLILRGGGVRRIPITDEDAVRGLLSEAGKAGVMVVRL